MILIIKYIPTSKKYVVKSQDLKLLREILKLFAFFDVTFISDYNYREESVDCIITNDASRYMVVINKGKNMVYTFNQALGFTVRKILEVLSDEAEDHFFIHGGCVEKGGNVTCLLGKTKSGKSTITNALCNLNFNYLTDDLICISKKGIVSSFPKPIFLREKLKVNNNIKFINVIEYEDEFRYCYLPKQYVISTKPLMINNIILLNRDDFFNFSCVKLSFAQAFIKIWENMYNNRNIVEKREIAINLAKQADVYQVYYNDFFFEFRDFKKLLW